MKRSEINAYIAWAKDFLERNNIRLPETAYWPPEKWRAHADAIGTVRRAMLGWDITDFGTGDLIAGEVSKVNDDNTDNYFLEPVARFADIEENEPPLHPLCNEY